MKALRRVFRALRTWLPWPARLSRARHRSASGSLLHADFAPPPPALPALEVERQLLERARTMALERVHERLEDAARAAASQGVSVDAKLVEVQSAGRLLAERAGVPQKLVATPEPRRFAWWRIGRLIRRHGPGAGEA